MSQRQIICDSNVWRQMFENSNRRQMSGNKCLKIQVGVKCLASNVWCQMSETSKQESNVWQQMLPVMPELGGGLQYLTDQLTLFLAGGQIIPIYYYWHPQCFSHSDITGHYSQMSWR